MHELEMEGEDGTVACIQELSCALRSHITLGASLRSASGFSCEIECNLHSSAACINTFLSSAYTKYGRASLTSTGPQHHTHFLSCPSSDWMRAECRTNRWSGSCNACHRGAAIWWEGSQTTPGFTPLSTEPHEMMGHQHKHVCPRPPRLL
jgi:hypothetical protein